MAVNAGYLYVYDASTALWGRTSLTETGWGQLVCSTFIGTPGTAISSYTDPCTSGTYALYPSTGTTQSIPLIDPTSGKVTLNTGAGTIFGDVLYSVAPTSPNYTASLSCTLTTSSYIAYAAIFARASSGANTQYALAANANTGVGSGASSTLYAVVAGTPTMVSNVPGLTWAVGQTHVFKLTVNGTAIIMSVDGTPYPATDSSIPAAGQVGFRVTQGMECTNFTVL